MVNLLKETEESIAMDFDGQAAYIDELEQRVSAMRAALAPFAEEPTERMNAYNCHSGITTKEKCGRCSRAIAAWRALQP
jgi:tetrahydromethanopterin S-methyltransferase subunit B